MVKKKKFKSTIAYEVRSVGGDKFFFSFSNAQGGLPAARKKAIALSKRRKDFIAVQKISVIQIYDKGKSML